MIRRLTAAILVAAVAFVSTAVTVLAFGQRASAGNWPQWRGPARDGSIDAPAAPAEWPTSFARTWRVDVGEGYSSPVVSAGRVFVHSRKDPIELVTAIDLSTGATVWQQSYTAAFTKNKYANLMAKGPNATPLVDDGRVFTLGASGLLVAWDAASGRRLWSKDFSGIVDTSKLFCGTSASPLLVNGLVVVQVGSDVGGGLVAALDPATGTSRWEWKGDGPGYASPAVIRVGSSSQIVTLTNRSVVGLDAAAGRLLWTIPFTDEWHENIVAPTWTGTELIVSGTRQGTHAYRLAERNGAWEATQAWKNSDIAMYMSSPVVADGVLYGHSARRKGQFVALDAASGAVKWATEGREGAHASVLLAPRHVVFLTEGGDLIVARRGSSGFEVEKRYEVAESETYAMPVVMGRDLIVRDATGVMRLAGR